MPAFDVSVELDRENATFAPGEPITGRVLVHARDAAECRRVVLRREWFTSGKGNVDAGGDEVELASGLGTLPEGTVVDIPFATEAPVGGTIRGEYLSVGWRLRAIADIAMGRDSRGDREIVLRPDPTDRTGGRGLLLPDVELPAPTEVQVRKSSGALAAAATGIGVVGLAGAGAGLAALAVSAAQPLVYIPSAIAGLGAVVVGYFGARNRIARTRLGSVSLEVEPRVVRPGATVLCRLRVAPTEQVELSGVTLRLVATETVVKGHGKHQAMYTRVARRVEVKSTGPLSAGPGPTDIEGEATVPTDAAPSFKSTYNTLAWSVDAVISVPRWPDWVRSAKLVVRP